MRLYKKKGNPIWYGWYFDADGNRQYFSTKTTDKKTAGLVVRERERAAYAPNRAAANKAPHRLEDALTYLVAESSSDRSAATLSMYAKKGGHLLRLLGDIDVNALKLDDTQRYINTRLDEGAAKCTVHKELCTLRRALQLAKGRGLLGADPRSLVPGFRFKYEPRRRQLTVAEFEALLRHLPTSKAFFVQVAVFLGPRLSELLALRWEHVDFESGWVLIPGQKTAGAFRMVPIPSALRSTLEAHAFTVLDDGQKRKKHGPLFESWNNVRRDLRKACEKAGIHPVSPNDLRRTFASWLKQAGVDSFTVARLMGHTTSRMVELVYGHINNTAFLKAMQQLPVLPERGSHRVVNVGSVPETPETHETAHSKEFQGFEVPKAGIEPATRGFSIPCSTN